MRLGSNQATRDGKHADRAGAFFIYAEAAAHIAVVLAPSKHNQDRKNMTGLNGMQFL